MLEIPRTQTVAEVVNPGPDARMAIRHDAPVATPGPGEVLLKLECTGVCHSDIRAYLGWGPYNAIVGHEGVGRVVAPAGHELLGARVGIKWLHNACGACSLCRKGRPNNCASQTNTGKHVPGTLAQYVVGAATHVSRIPEGLASEVAAPLLCAGLTMVGALNPLKELEKGDWVVISGSGGGLGHVGVQLAAARGLRVIAVDAGKSKKTLSLESGATAFIDYKTDDVASEVRRITEEGAHAAIVVPGDATAFEAAPPLVRNGGVIVCVGLPPNDYTLPIGASILSARALTVTGVSVGTEKEMDELLALAADGRVTSKVEVVDFERIGEVMERLKNDEITGRVVVRLPQ
ncbi:GroES-like protein [Cutaneotrichosporon oleaginosum]|uniref:GroES-like protein n=1 Tax=Cutaneotrichosporon oleaginosum TaxID=879819 RepID=A0A0J0XYU9_9TREE|nr:GroES-like protein [Cutaneotrichosporon oleaginosum]KLT46233.1 GroES-like protein [Cutaneotrichosporon oleaginosum]TXT10239.1 hypothetical protein COLE_04173 [Cutaneotrichosporon oleaginosum]